MMQCHIHSQKESSLTNQSKILRHSPNIVSETMEFSLPPPPIVISHGKISLGSSMSYHQHVTETLQLLQSEEVHRRWSRTKTKRSNSRRPFIPAARRGETRWRTFQFTSHRNSRSRTPVDRKAARENRTNKRTERRRVILVRAEIAPLFPS